MTTNPPPPKPKAFRMEAKNFFLTFPQVNVSRALALSNLKTHFSHKLKGAIVAQEHHADGSLHLHILVFLSEKLRTRDSTYFDFVCAKHGSYETIKRVSSALSYVQKEDKEPLIFGDIPSGNSALTRSKSDAAAEMIQSGCSLSQLAKEMPGYFLSNQEKIRKFQSFCIEQKLNESLARLQEPLRDLDPMGELSPIVAWLNTNLFSKRKFKQLQLYLYGPPNSGKTSLILRLSKYFRIYHIPNGEDFYDFFENDKYDLAVLDEFRADKTIQWMNAWLQGSEMNIRQKGSQCLKVQNIPTIILSNFTPHEAYSKSTPEKLETLITRIEVIKVTNIHISDQTWEAMIRPPDPDNPDPDPAPIQTSNDKDEEIDFSWVDDPPYRNGGGGWSSPEI